MTDSIYGSDIRLRMGQYAGFYGIGADLYVNRRATWTSCPGGRTWARRSYTAC